MDRWRNKKTRLDFEECELKITGMKILVFNSHILYPGEWLMSCYPLNLSQYKLKAESAKDAKEEAVKTVKYQLIKWVSDLGGILKEG